MKKICFSLIWKVSIQKRKEENYKYEETETTLSLCSAVVRLYQAQHCSGDTMALISSSVGSLKSGLSTHQLESIPSTEDQTKPGAVEKSIKIGMSSKEDYHLLQT